MTARSVGTDAVYVMVGPSSSGKSTWAADAAPPNAVISSDALRGIVGESPHDQRAGTDAFDALHLLVERRVARGLVTVVDTLGFDAARRATWIAQAHAAGLRAVAVVMRTDAATCRSRNADRMRPLPKKVHDQQLKAMVTIDDELAEDGFDEIIDGTPARLVAPAFVATPRDEPAPPAPPGSRLEFGLHISRFDGDAEDLGSRLREIAQVAEEVGFSSLWVMDHVIQIPQVGRAWEPMLESWTTLSHLAAATETIRIGTLVTGITYRNIAHLAKIVATLDVLSGGRVNCGLGAAWFAQEHTAYGWEFPPLRERYAMLSDALQLLPKMWGPGSKPFSGEVVAVPSTTCYPRPLQEKIPILVGGQGEKRTLRLVAEHADACNLFGDPDEVARKVAVLHAHCTDVGRDPAEVGVTILQSILVGTDDEDLALLIEDLRPPQVAATTWAARNAAGTVADHHARFARFAEVGVGTAIISLPRLDVDLVRRAGALI